MKKHTIFILLAALTAQSTDILCMHEFFRPNENSYKKFMGDNGPSLPTHQPSITEQAALKAKQRAQNPTGRTLTIATTPRSEAGTPIAQPASPTARPRLTSDDYIVVDTPTPADSPIHHDSLESFLGTPSPRSRSLSENSIGLSTRERSDSTEGFNMAPEATLTQSPQISRPRASTKSGNFSSLQYSPEPLSKYEKPTGIINEEGIFVPEKESFTLDIPATQSSPSAFDRIKNAAQNITDALTLQQPKIPLSSFDFQRKYINKKTSAEQINYLYEIFGLKQGASDKEIEAQYNKLVKNKSLSYDQQKTLRDIKNMLTKGETPRYLLPKDRSSYFLD